MNNRKKSLHRYLWVTFVSAFVGGVCGGLAMMSRNLDWNLGWLLKLLPIILSTMSTIFIIVILVFTIVKYFKAKKYVQLSNDEDEEIYLIADSQLSLALSFNTVGTIVGMLGLGFVIPMLTYWKIEDASAIHYYAITLGMTSVVIFCVYVLITTCLQVKIVDLIQKIYPEKEGYALDKKFEKQWFENADENERKIIGEASYHSYRITQKVMSYLLVIALFIGFFQPDSYLFIILIGIGWLTLTITYLKKARDLEFKKK